jgi:phosphate:Na+ symporter
VQLSALIAFAGGIGLFLLGMRLMSDGLKVAAGPALRDLLGRATRSRLRALAAGGLITALVQSSSAVIFATIGFVNAGLLSLGQAVGVIFGANLGTTLTSWIVAVIGFNVKLQMLAMPAVALGMLLWVGGGRRAALGQALAGFGIFFLGLDVLKDAFAGLGDSLDLARWAGEGALQLLLFVGIGFVLTLLMQSSSAALAVTLTAAAGGVIALPAAAAMVIGANVGTTSTALFATIGATAAARRAAAAHVIFNLVAAIASLLLLPLLLVSARWLVEAFTAQAQPAVVLAAIHTLAKLLGVALMWPFTNRLVHWLEQRFERRDADPGLPHHLDRNVLSTPRLALDALAMELRRMSVLAQQMARAALSSERRDDAALAAVHQSLQRLGEASIAFAGAVNSGGDPVVDAGLPHAVRVVQYYRGMAERALELGRIVPAAELPAALQAQVDALHSAADHALDASDPARSEGFDRESIDRLGDAFESVYQQCKAELLRAGSRGELSPAALVRVLDRASALRRIVDQSCKAGRYLLAMGEAGEPAPSPELA